MYMQLDILAHIWRPVQEPYNKVHTRLVDGRRHPRRVHFSSQAHLHRAHFLTARPQQRAPCALSATGASPPCAQNGKYRTRQGAFRAGKCARRGPFLPCTLSSANPSLLPCHAHFSAALAAGIPAAYTSLLVRTCSISLAFLCIVDKNNRAQACAWCFPTGKVRRTDHQSYISLML